MTYSEWQTAVLAQRALVSALGSSAVAAVTLPSNVPAGLRAYVGQPAARYSNAAYVALYNAGQIDPGAIQVASPSGEYVYVVAPASVWSGAPHTMTTAERVANAVYTTGDSAADAVGVGGSLGALHDFLTETGRQIVIGIAVTVGVAYFLKRKR